MNLYATDWFDESVAGRKLCDCVMGGCWWDRFGSRFKCMGVVWSAQLDSWCAVWNNRFLLGLLLPCTGDMTHLDCSLPPDPDSQRWNLSELHFHGSAVRTPIAGVRSDPQWKCGPLLGRCCSWTRNIAPDRSGGNRPPTAESTDVQMVFSELCFAPLRTCPWRVAEARCGWTSTTSRTWAKSSSASRRRRTNRAPWRRWGSRLCCTSTELGSWDFLTAGKDSALCPWTNGWSFGSWQNEPVSRFSSGARCADSLPKLSWG